jgi:hypothetical protein
MLRRTFVGAAAVGATSTTAVARGHPELSQGCCSHHRVTALPAPFCLQLAPDATGATRAVAAAITPGAGARVAPPAQQLRQYSCGTRTALLPGDTVRELYNTTLKRAVTATSPQTEPTNVSTDEGSTAKTQWQAMVDSARGRDEGSVCIRRGAVVKKGYLVSAPTGYEGTIVLIEDCSRKVTVTASSDPALFGLITDTHHAADTGDHNVNMIFAPASPTQTPLKAHRPTTPETLLKRIKSLRGDRSLREALKARGSVFLAPDPAFRALGDDVLTRDNAKFPFVCRKGRPLAPELRDVIMIPLSANAHRPALLNVGVRGSGKTVLLLRALEAIPEAVPEWKFARIYVTFNATTTDAVAQGPHAFAAGMLLRVFHAVLATLGADEDFVNFFLALDWTQFTDHEFLLPKLAEALGVQTLVIAIDEVALGVEMHSSHEANMECEVTTELRSLFSWAETPRPRTGGAPHLKAQTNNDQTPPVVIPIASCYYPRYAWAVASGGGRELRPLQVDLAPFLDDVVAQLEVDGRPDEARRFRDDLFVKQHYTACGGHFLLCASVCAEVLKKSPQSVLAVSLPAALGSQVNTLVPGLLRLNWGLATMLAQTVSGMTFRELQTRHGDVARPLDPFFQLEDGPSNLPLAVVMHKDICGHHSFKSRTALNDAFALWIQAAREALHQSTTEMGVRNAFGEMIVHGLTLRWAAFLAPWVRTTPAGATAAAGPDNGVGFCVGEGFFMDDDGNVCAIDLSLLRVREPCKYTCGQTFPPPSARDIALNTYTLAGDANSLGVEGVGCVAASLPAPFDQHHHAFFTVQLKHGVTDGSGHFADYTENLPQVVGKMPNDPNDATPCIHLFFTPHRYTPQDGTIKEALLRLRRGRDVVACVNVHDCMTPSLAWTLACIPLGSLSQHRSEVGKPAAHDGQP